MGGKYYSTEVELALGDETVVIPISTRGDGTPSDRELQHSIGCSREEYDRNDLVRWSAWGEDTMVPAQDAWDDYCCNDHYETQDTYELAQEIVAAVSAHHPRKQEEDL